LARVTAPLRYSTLGSGLLAGRMPHATAHVEALHAEGVRTVINLCEEHEYWDGERAAVEAAFLHARIAEHRLPVPDGATIPPDVLDQAVAAAAGETAYVHCRGGRERSAAVAVALLAARRGITIDEALADAKARWPTCRPLPWQMAGVRAWAAGRTS
jgi:atypical dual specificity phosphatase